MRAVVVVVFFGWLCASIAVSPKIEVGLDQELSVPEDSYVLNYFEVFLLKDNLHLILRTVLYDYSLYIFSISPWLSICPNTLLSELLFTL